MIKNDTDQVALLQPSSIKSPLRYPGGKSRAVQTILALIPDNTHSICAPFIGGASVELSCAAKNIKVFGSDLFEPLVNFWQCILKNPNEVADKAQQYLPLQKERFYQLQRSYHSIQNHIERAAVFFVLNRASYSGATLAGGMSPGHPRFTPSSIQRLRNFHTANLQVKHLNYKDALDQNPPQRLAYLDPPYMIQSNNLYGYKGNMHSNFDHAELYQTLKQRPNWILSYNDCPEIRELYKQYEIIKPNWIYGMSNNKKSRELLVLNIECV